MGGCSLHFVAKPTHNVMSEFSRIGARPVEHSPIVNRPISSLDEFDSMTSPPRLNCLEPPNLGATWGSLIPTAASHSSTKLARDEVIQKANILSDPIFCLCGTTPENSNTSWRSPKVHGCRHHRHVSAFFCPCFDPSSVLFRPHV